MSEALSKRSISEVDLSSDANDDTKKSSKPGRKPLKSEPKNKRTAQNRAAQRAFRERKERRMKELEEKVEALENEKIQATTESEFLRAQVEILMAELSKTRGTDANPLDIAKEISLNIQHIDHKKQNMKSRVTKNSVSPATSQDTPTSTPNVDSNSTLSSVSNNTFTFQFPWSKSNLQSLTSSNLQDSQVPGLSVASCSSVSNSSNSPNQEINYTLISDSLNPSGAKTTETFDFENHFDEPGNTFCDSLNEVCGTKDCPIPKCKPHSNKSNFSSPGINSLNSVNSPFSNLISKDSNSVTDQNNTNSNPSPGISSDDPLSFLTDSAFDVSLAFNFDNFDSNDGNLHSNNLNLFDDTQQPFDPISMLTTEESVYDPLGSIYNESNELSEKYQRSTSIPSSSIPNPQLPSKDDDDEEEDVVPSNDKNLMKCSEIWDRITAHPRYSEIDIDGLCSELKAKAKCSEKGVVISSDEVTNILNKSK